jgi:hypothetical protein
MAHHSNKHTCLLFFTVGQAGRLVGRLVGKQVGRLAGWQVGRLAGWQVCRWAGRSKEKHEGKLANFRVNSCLSRERERERERER